MAPVKKLSELSRRERQIMDVVYRRGKATANEVYADLDDPPAETSVRKLIRVLQAKGHLVPERRGRGYVYRPTVAKRTAALAAARRLLEVFYNDSASEAVAGLLSASRDSLSEEEIRKLERLIDDATAGDE